MKPTNYVSLHTHSDYSRLDSIAKIKDLVKKARKLGMKSIALTDHGTISGWLQFYKHCSLDKSGNILPPDEYIKPIFGVEAYIVEDAKAIENIEQSIGAMEDKKKNNLPLFDGILENVDEEIEDLKQKKSSNRKSNHVILLAKNAKGYENIIKMTTWGYKEGYYYKPRIDLKSLREHSEGVICTSACLGGQISYNILKGNLEKAEEYVREYKDIFGDDFYIEIQLHGVDEQIKANKKNIEFAKKYNIPVVIAQDVHYVEAADVELHELVIRLKNKEKEVVKKDDDLLTPKEIDSKVKKVKNKRLAMIEEQALLQTAKVEKDAVDSDGYFYNAREYYFKTFQEMEETWKKYHSYIPQEDFYKYMGNTLLIAEKVERINAYSNVAYLPKIANEEGVESKDLFKQIVKEGAKRKLGPKVKDKPELKAIYEKRLQEELDTIFNLGFEDYFLIVWDFINWARKNDIAVGPGRGSVGGSLVAYCADIHKIDPIEHSLLFSRFINKTRSSAKYKIEFDDARLEKK